MIPLSKYAVRLLALMACFFALTYSLLAQKSKSLSNAQVKQMEIEAAQDYIDATTALRIYFDDESDEAFAIFHSKCLASYRLITFLEKNAGKAQLDTLRLPGIKNSLETMKDVTIERARELAEGDERINAVFFAGLSVEEHVANDLISKLSDQ